eukprot:365661-Chlamydomonas_euryale.AAC.52
MATRRSGRPARCRRACASAPTKSMSAHDQPPASGSGSAACSVLGQPLALVPACPKWMAARCTPVPDDPDVSM